MFNYKLVEDIIGYEFQDKRILLEAFTHSSYANENADVSYERLEFLGDSILGLVVSKFLFNNYKDEDEGFLTKTKAKIVSGKSLAAVMNDIGLIDYVRTAQGSIEKEIKTSANIKEDLFEAIVGAIYIDSGSFDLAENFIFKFLGQKISVNYISNESSDYKSTLLELMAKNHKNKIKFVVKPLATNVNNGFEATVYINDVKYGEGREISKKKAEQIAAKNTLYLLKK